MDSLLPDTSNINIKESEANFQKAFDNYWHTDVTKHDESYYKAQMDIMWMCVYCACANICKSVYKSRCVIVDDLEDVILDATEYSMRFITGENKLKRLYRPNKLGTWCYLRCIHFIDSPTRKWNDMNVFQLPKDHYKDRDMDFDSDKLPFAYRDEDEVNKVVDYYEELNGVSKKYRREKRERKDMEMSNNIYEERYE